VLSFCSDGLNETRGNVVNVDGAPLQETFEYGVVGFIPPSHWLGVTIALGILCDMI
jgi:hypothetical protein